MSSGPPAVEALAAGSAVELDALQAALHTALVGHARVAQGWAELWRGAAPEPWTDAAMDHFDGADEDPSGRWCLLHHRAVAHHARAYDEEAAGWTGPAREHWAAALYWWAELLTEPGFRDAARERLTEMFGDRSECANAVDDLERLLPQYLLAVHLELARHHQERGATRAAAGHIAIVRDCALPRAARDSARAALAAAPVAQAETDVDRAAFGRAFGTVGSWLDVDPSNPWLLACLLRICDAWICVLNREGSWFRPAGRLLDQARDRLRDAGLDPLRAATALPAPDLARYLCWVGFHTAQTVPEDLSNLTNAELQMQQHTLEGALDHLRAALRLDPTLGRDGFYVVDRDVARVLVRLVEAGELLDDPPAARRALLDEATRHDPAHPDIARLRRRIDRENGVSAATVRALLLARDAQRTADALERFAATIVDVAGARELGALLAAAGALLDREPTAGLFHRLLLLQEHIVTTGALDGAPYPHAGDAVPPPNRSQKVVDRLPPETVGPSEQVDERMPNPWRWTGDNPYRTHAFSVLRIVVPPRRRKEISTAGRAAVARARTRGDLPAVRAAQDAVRAPHGFLVEDMLLHRPHPVPIPADTPWPDTRPVARPVPMDRIELHVPALLAAVDDRAKGI